MMTDAEKAGLSKPPALPVGGPDTDRSSSNSERTTRALQRLAVSREQLQLRLMPRAQTAANKNSGTGFRMPLRWRALGRVLLSRGPSAALGRAAMATLTQWWKNQPWHFSAEMLGKATLQELTPVVRRHPLLTVAAAAGLGAAVFALRPWRGLSVARHVKPLGGHIAQIAWRLFTQAPVQVAVATALAAWLGDQQREPQEQSPPPSPSSPPDGPYSG